MDHELLRSQLERHEGLRLYPYLDSTSHMTIGYGRNLDTVGISRTEANIMLDNDIYNVETELKRLPQYNALNGVRQTVIANMTVNMGLPTVLQFKKMWRAIDNMDWEEAAEEMLASRWHQQVGRRAEELAQIMRDGHA
jgi:lysozyme